MKRILIIGNSPLPNENTKSRPAAGLRTYQFLKPLLRKGGIVISDSKHAFSAEKRPEYLVKLITIAMPECYEGDIKKKEIVFDKNFSELRIPKNSPGLQREVQQIHDEFHPEVIIAVNTYPSYVAASLNSLAPLWTDLNGWIMAEGQAQAYKKESNDYVPHYHKMEKTIVERSDKFSTVSEAQRFALLGELGFCGRLNKESFAYEFVHCVPNGTVWFQGEREERSAEEENAGEEEKIPADAGMTDESEITKTAGINVPKDAFVLLWMGGYNTWVDEQTLFKGVEAAMKKCENLYFVSTGGKIKGLDNNTFSKFKNLIDQSEFKDRFVFLGWVETKNISYIYERADLGINVDRKCTETFTGARNRINEMMKFGLPIITTLGSEISYEVERVGAGVGVPSGKYELLEAAIYKVYKEWEDSRFRGNDNRGNDNRGNDNRGNDIRGNDNRGNDNRGNDIRGNDNRGNDNRRITEYGERGQDYIAKECSYEKTIRPLLKWLENPRPAPDRGVVIDFGRAATFRGGIRYLKDNGIKKFLKKLLQKI